MHYRKPTDHPSLGGHWGISPWAQRRERRKMLLIGGILIAIGLAALAVFIARGGF